MDELLKIAKQRGTKDENAPKSKPRKPVSLSAKRRQLLKYRSAYKMMRD